MGLEFQELSHFIFLCWNNLHLSFLLILGHNTEVAGTSACIEAITDKTYSDPNPQQRCDQNCTWH